MCVCVKEENVDMDGWEGIELGDEEVEEDPGYGFNRIGEGCHRGRQVYAWGTVFSNVYSVGGLYGIKWGGGREGC